MSLEVLGIVTARGGSKGVPRKNLADLCGRSLIAHTAESALASARLGRVIVSTDDSEIADEAQRCGLEVPFMRPDDLAKDNTATLPVLQDAVRRLEDQGQRFDAICLLQPTHPCRTAEDIDGCIDLLISSQATAVVTVSRIPDEYNPHWAYLQDESGALKLADGRSAPIPRRQELPPAYHREGSVYVTRRDVLMDENSLYGDRLIGYVVDAATRVNIDTPADLRRARELFEQAGVKA